MQDIDKKSRCRSAFYLIYCVRRIVYVYIIFFIDHIPGIQLVLLNLMNLAIMTYTSYFGPLIGVYQNRLETFNEISVCFITFHMFYFTDWTLGFDIDSLPDKYLQPDRDILAKKNL
jgi:hypothetical protein